MENSIFTKDVLFAKEKFYFLRLAVKNIQLILSSTFILFFISGCASSNVSRTMASNIDMGVQNSKNLWDNATADGSIADSYQNTSQTTKGAILGGTVGGVTGALSSGIGFIPGAATGLMLGASYGAYIDANTSLKDQLENRGATVIVLGDQVLIIIPSARIFKPMCPEIKPTAYSTLYLLAQFINSFQKMLVKVSVYTNQSGSAGANRRLSQQQANHIGKFLTASGIDARVLYSVGYGGTHLVEKSCSDAGWESSDNYRIEVTLEKLPEGYC